LDTDIGCDTVLVDVTYNNKETLQNSYNADDNPLFRRIFVEFTYFIQHCIQNNQFIHRIPALKGMGGTVGRAYVPIFFNISGISDLPFLAGCHSRSLMMNISAPILHGSFRIEQQEVDRVSRSTRSLWKRLVLLF
jgi:hypothetical protein